MKMVLAHRRGEVELPGYTVTVAMHKSQSEDQPQVGSRRFAQP